MYATRLHIPAISSKKEISFGQMVWERMKASGCRWWAMISRDGADLKRKPTGLRILWLLVLLAGFGAWGAHTYFLVYRQAQRGQSIVERSEVDARATGVQLPAVILCPMNWVNTKKLKTLFGLDAEDPTFVYMKSIMSRRAMTKSSVNTGQLIQSSILPLDNITQFNETYATIKKRWQALYPADNPYSDVSFFIEIGYKCAEALQDCSWNGFSFDCCKDTRPIFTPYGQCFLLKPPRTDELSKLAPPAGNQIIPGPEGGLLVKILTDKRGTSSSASTPAPSSTPTAPPPQLTKAHNGTVLYFADPYLLSASDRSSSIPFTVLQPLFAPANTHAFISLQAIERRNQEPDCTPSPLKYFSSYSEEGCEIECRINASIEILDCATLGDSAAAPVDNALICQAGDFHDKFVAAANRFASTTPAPSTTSGPSPTTTSRNQNSPNATNAPAGTTTRKPQTLLSAGDYSKAKIILDEQYHFSYVNCTRRSCSAPACQPSREWIADMSYFSLYERESILSSAQGADPGSQNATADGGVEYEDFSRVTIFFPKLSYETWLKRSRSSNFELLSSIGGALALWVGISVVAVLQVLCHCVWVAVSTCCRRAEGSQNPPTTPNSKASIGTASARGRRSNEDSRSVKTDGGRTKVHQLNVTV